MKRFLVYFFTLIFFYSSIVHASVPVGGGWTLGDAVVQGATTTWNATKNVGGKIATGVASIKPTPAQVAEGLKKAGIVGLALTVTQELLDGVDFVLDPANNTIRYKPKVLTFGYFLDGDSKSGGYFATPQEVCRAYNESGKLSVSGSVLYVEPSSNYLYGSCRVAKSVWSIKYYAGTSSNKDLYNTITIDAFASQMIDAAQKKDAKAQAFVSAVAQTALAEKEEDQIVPMAQLTQALDASQTLTDEDVKSPSTTVPTVDNPAVPDTDIGTATGTNTGTATDNPADTPKDQDLPAFCSWAPNACAWFTWTKEKYDASVQSITDFFKDPEEEKEKNDKVEEEKGLPQLSTDTFSFGGSCPADIKLAIPDPFGGSHELPLSFTNLCTWLEKLKPWVDVLGWIIALSILTGQRSNNSE